MTVKYAQNSSAEAHLPTSVELGSYSGVDPSEHGDADAETEDHVLDLSVLGVAGADKLRAFIHDCDDDHLKAILDDEGAALKTKRVTSPAAKEARLMLVYRMMVRGMTNHDIAKQIGVSTRSVTTIKREVGERIKHQVGHIDFGAWAGERMGFYQEVKAMAMAVAGDKGSDSGIKLFAINTAMRAVNDEQRFLERCHVFKAVGADNSLAGSFQTSQESEEITSAAFMTGMAKHLRDEGAHISHQKALIEQEIEDGEIRDA